VELKFPAKDLAYWKVASNSFVVEPGDFTLMVGSSSEDIKSIGKFTVK
jgi:beta-glucosidase